MRLVAITFFVFILASLFSAGYFLLKDKSGSTRMVKALTTRIVLSIALFVLLLVALKLGLIPRGA